MLLTLEKSINRLMDWVGGLATLILIVLVAIVTYNVIGRYVFRSSSIGLEELSWHLYAAVFLLGIPYGLKSRAHVRVDLFFERLSPKTQALIDLFGTVLFLVPFCGVVIWGGFLFTAEAWSLGDRPDDLTGLIKQIFQTGVGEKSQDPGGLLNRWIIKGVIPFSFLFLLLASISFGIAKLRIYKTGEMPDTNRRKSQ